MPQKDISPRNKTIYITPEDKIYEGDLLFAKKSYTKDEVTNKTICADLFEVLESLPAEFADLIIIDPPYNLSKNFNGLDFKASSSDDYYKYLKSWFGRVCRLLKPNGTLYMCGDWRSTSAMQEVIEEELTVLNRITWQREKGRGAASNWKNSMEDIWFAVKNPKDYYFDVDSVKIKRRVIALYRVEGKPKDWQQEEDGNFRLTHPSNFWDDITVPYWSMPENTEHPTQKPEKLIAKLILASSPKDGVVFDPFLGSGTTSVVAKKLGRRFCGVEINREYALIAQKRLAMVAFDSTIQGYANGVFWERNSLSAQKL
ncbi:Putative methyltransferase [Mucinivorans hirudinis]|uniref:Methyltransferase n=1 Tax=Mucinivorans hirudinis TaxID=1433126 RepID=A0A060RDG7_9BACT|nr:Putative methyltransferase [Mucinivorans hirudinis]